MSDSAYVTTFEFDVEGDSEAGAAMDRLAGKTKEVGEKTEETEKKTSRFTGVLKNSALGLTAAASGAVGLYFQFDNLQKGSLKVESAQKNLTVAQATLASSQNSLNKLVEKGVNSGPEYEASVLRLKGAQEQLAISQQKVGIAQGDLSQQQLQFALGVVPTAISTVSALTGIVDGLKKAKLLSVAASGAEAAAEGGSRLAKIAAIPATFAATAATHRYAAAIKGAFVAMGPIGWAMIGITTAAGLFATNFLGVRDAVNAAGKAIGHAFPIMKPLLDGLTSLATMIFPETANEAEAMKQDTMKSFSVLSTEGSMAFDSLETNVDRSADSIVKDVDRIKASMGSIGIKTAGVKTEKNNGFNWIGFGENYRTSSLPAASSVGSMGSSGGIVRLELKLDEKKLIQVIEKTNTTGIKIDVIN
jgi:hypothetical protein